MLVRVALGATQPTTGLATTASAGSVDSQSHKPGVLKGLVPLGAMQHLDQCRPGGGWIQPLGEIAQRVVAERAAQRQGAGRRTGQLLDGEKARLAQQTADEQGPHQQPSWDLGLRPPIARLPEIAI